MKITLFGCALTGLVTAGALASTGNEVMAVPLKDSEDDSSRLAALQQGALGREEPGLSELIQTQLAAGRLQFTEDWTQAIGHAEVIFLSMPSWQAKQAQAVVEAIGCTANRSLILVNQVTLPVGTADLFAQKLQADFVVRGVKHSVQVVVMPEFITEGAAIENFMRPDRIILGSKEPEAIAVLKELMHPFNRMTDQVKVMSTRSAEYSKYAVNALLATRISLMNELANNAETLGVDIEQVRQGIGADSRIGYSYLYPGTGYGGPSFAADIQFLVQSLQSSGSEVELLQGALTINEMQKEVMFRKAWRFFQADLIGKKIAVWGLAFKPNTDTITNAPSLKTIAAFVSQGAEVFAYDPKANAKFSDWWGKRSGVILQEDPYAVLQDAEALVILTEWKHFWSPDFERMRDLMHQAVIFDGRNLYDPKRMQEKGFRYFAVGRGELI